MTQLRTSLRASLEELAEEFVGGVLRALRGAAFTEIGELRSGDRASSAPPTADRATQGQAGGELAKLTARERDIFERVLRGSTNAKMARDLGIGVKTVQTHRAKVNKTRAPTAPPDRFQRRLLTLAELAPSRSAEADGPSRTRT